jgi:FkbM family methyltransferase
MKARSLQDRGALFDLLTAAEIRLVDIGGRGAAMPQLVPLAQVAHYYACEPDIHEAERLKVQLPQDEKWRSVTVMTEALASQEGDATLHLTQQPGMSSLLEPDLAVADRFCVGPKFYPASLATVPTITLDHAAVQYGFQDAAFLKLDTQGTELDILQSGPTVVDSLVGVYVESLFHPFYKGQSLFSDVDVYLRARGFSLFGLFRTMLRRAGFRPDLYSRRVITWAHCLYFREPTTLLGADRTVAARNITRQLGLALAFQHHDLAFELLAIAERESLFPAGAAQHVKQDVDVFINDQSSRLVRKARKEGGEQALVGRSSRDNRYVE